MMSTAEGLAPLSPRAASLLRAALPQRVENGAVEFAFPHCSDMEEPQRSSWLAAARAVVLRSGPEAPDGLEVRVLSPNHPAAPGHGLFATRDVAAGTPLLVYGGTLRVGGVECRRSKLRPDGSRNRYVFDCLAGGELEAVVDGSMEPRSLASYCNDGKKGGMDDECVNIGSVELVCGGGEPCRDGGVQPAVVHPIIIFFACRAISAGDELLTSYGDCFWREGPQKRRAWR